MRYLLVTAFAAAILYGASYQQFRSFSFENPGGATDAVHYVGMARHDSTDAPEVWHGINRRLTPGTARLIKPMTDRIVSDDDLSMRLAFYLVNFAFSLAAAVVFFRALQTMRYSVLLSLLGVCAFAASRVTVLVTATPMVDAAYFCAIAILVCLTLEQQALALAVMLPLLVVTKETIIPFLFLPFFTELRKSPVLWAGAAAAAVTFVFSGHATVVDAMLDHTDQFAMNAARVLTIRGLYDLQNGFSLILPLSVIGAWLNARHRYHQVPAVVVAVAPIALGLALLSGNLGRMFFAAFPVVIAYALITVEHVAGRSRTGDSR